MANSYLNLKVITAADMDNPTEVSTWLATLASANIIYAMTVSSNVFYIVYH